MFVDPMPYSQLLCLPGGKKLAHGESSGSSQAVVLPLIVLLDLHSACAIRSSLTNVLSCALRLTLVRSEEVFLFVAFTCFKQGGRSADRSAGKAVDARMRVSNLMSNRANNDGMILVTPARMIICSLG